MNRKKILIIILSIILIYSGYTEFTYYIAYIDEYKKIQRDKQTCEIIKESIDKYHNNEKIVITELIDLKKKYIQNIDMFKDSFGWGGINLDTHNQIIYSKGPDRKTTYSNREKRIKSMDKNDQYVADDIFVRYEIPEFLQEKEIK